MGSEYTVNLGNESIGSASVSREGLYYRIRCRCRLSGAVPCRVIVIGKKDVDLGLCVPMGDEFGLEKRVPMKTLGEGELRFQVSPKHQVDQGTFIPITPDEPFHYIQSLKNAYLSKRNGKPGLVIRAQSQDQRDSDQNP